MLRVLASASLLLRKFGLPAETTSIAQPLGPLPRQSHLLLHWGLLDYTWAGSAVT